MEDWMRYEAMLGEVLQRPGAYPYPFGSVSLGELARMTDADLRRLSYERLVSQALSVDMVFAEWKGRYRACWHVAEQQGLTPYLDEQISQAAHALTRLQVQQRRLRALLKAAPQPRQWWTN